MKKINVLIIDDSALIRQALSAILNADPDIEVTGIASDPYVAVKQIQKQEPDVITLDLQMPRMDGLTFLKKLMAQHPIPVVVISGITTDGSGTALKALEYGAVQVLHKPDLSLNDPVNETGIRICEAVKAASQAKLGSVKQLLSLNLAQPVYSAPVTRKPVPLPNNWSNSIIAIGASVGGTEALKVILREIPPGLPGIVVVQHMPAGFTRLFAEGLDNTLDLHVKEAENGETITRSTVLIAEGDHHLTVRRTGNRFQVELTRDHLINRHRPSVDVLFHSIARCAGPEAIGVILTGMGNDGANGLLDMKRSGAYTIAQDEETCVVYGMPREAVKLGAVDAVLPIHQIAPSLIRLVKQKGM